MRVLRPGEAPAGVSAERGTAIRITRPCRDEGEQARGDEGGLVVAEPRAGRAGAPGGDGGAELMGAEDPAEDDADVLATEGTEP